MARLLTRSNLTANFSSYSPDVLLFFPLDQVKDLVCKAFYTVASQGDLSLLANGSAQRTHLLENALSCFGVGNASLSKEQLQALGAFVCDMGAATIGFSDPSILENLKRCPDLTASQKTALNTLLSSGKTSSGAPQSWDEETLEDLGPLALYINRTTWGSINQEERTIFLRNVAEGYGSQSASQREKTLLFLTEVGPNPASSPRRKRATESCQSTPITASTLEDDLLILQYDSAQQFDACLSNEVLRDNLASLLDQPLPNDYLLVIKRKLDEIYNGEIPEDQLALLGYLSRLYSADEIGGWNVTSSDTLTALLNRNNGAWEPAQLRRLVGRYLELGGTLTGPLLDVLEGPYLCLLDEDQLQQISPEAIAHTGKLDLSSCSQGKKDILYQKAHTAFASQEGTDAYYPLIQPYLGGAPVEDLKALAASEVAMDINTFINLNPEELKELSVQDVRGLLGIHLPDLKEVENHTSVAMWIRAQLQSDLDTLGIGLQGGMMTPSSTEASSTAVGVPIASGPPSADTSVTPTMGSTLSAPSSTAPLGFKATTVTTIGIVPSADFPTSLMAASSKVTATSEETTTRSPATEADVNMTTPGEFTLDSSTATSNAVALPLVPVLSNVTSTSNETTTRAPATTSDFSTMAPGEITVESNTTALPPILMDSTTAVPTTLIPVFSNVTSTSNETTTRPPATVTDFNMTTPGEITLDSSTATSNTVALPLVPVLSNVTSTSNETTTRAPATTSDFSTMAPGEITIESNTTALPPILMDSTIAIPTTLIPVFSNVTSTSNETTTRSPATETGTSAETAEAPSTTVTDDTPLPATTADTNTTFATTATISLTSTIGMHHTLHVNETTSSTNVTRATMPGLATMPSKGPSAPLKPMPNATSPALISKATEVIDRSPTTSSTSTVHAPETFHKTDVPPGSVPTQKTTLTPTETRRTTSRPAAATPPSYPTPNGYINVQPLSGSASKPALHWLFMTLTITAVISVLRMCL
ncbi:mesothelin-like protein [Hemicordylus capensis]|uniref:mesothelin-like protein n=1 Tax=Hemicordylus capensis TaxID=884348 RepID=UPI002304665D|nr:mesothelin-like protein [Hemicordylus capensis]